MPDTREIYQSRADDYDALVRCEDREGNLLRAIQAIIPLKGLEVAELGAGTGRLTLLLAPLVRSIRAFDIAAPMVDVARRHVARLNIRNCDIGVADNASLPLPDCIADLAIAGWTYGHQTVWKEDGWRQPIEMAIHEMRRVLRPEGTAIIIETLGTGHTAPFNPPAQLARYYNLLAHELGFERTWIRSDYEFPSMTDGERLLLLFFGEELAKAFVTNGSCVLPECTGLWWRKRRRPLRARHASSGAGRKGTRVVIALTVGSGPTRRSAADATSRAPMLQASFCAM